MITKEDFDRLKRFDRITDSRGYTDGDTWEVVFVGVGRKRERERLVHLVCQNHLHKPESYVCFWDEARGHMASNATGEIVPEFEGKHAYVHKESVDQVVLEMLTEKKLSPEQAQRLIEAGRNDRRDAIAADDCH